jgi:hypothetical protein
LGKALFVLAHLRALHSIVNFFPSCLFRSITDDIHIIGPLSIVLFTYEHFQIELRAIGLSIQPYKCVTWSPSGLPFDFNTPSQFTTLLKGIRVLGVPLGTSSFTLSFIKYALVKDVHHVDFFLRMGDVLLAFGILTYYFIQRPSYFLRFTPPSSTFIESFTSFDSSLLQVFGCLLGPRSFSNLDEILAYKQVSLLITFGGIGCISTTIITPTTY